MKYNIKGYQTSGPPIGNIQNPFSPETPIYTVPNDFNIGQSQFDNNINPNQLLYPNIYSPDLQVEHMRASNQSGLGIAGRFLGNLGVDIVTGLGSTGLTAVDYTFGQLPPIHDYLIKPLDDILTNIRDYSHEHVFKIYKDQGYDEAGIAGKIMTPYGFANDVENGLSFIIQNMFVGKAVAGLGLKAAQGLGMLKTLAQDPVKLARAGQLIDDIGASVLTALNEANIEGEETRKNVRDSLLADLVDARMKGNPFGMTTEDIDRKALEAKSKTVGLNTALLLVSNFIDFKALRGSYFDDIQKLALADAKAETKKRLAKAGVQGVEEAGEDAVESTVKRSALSRFLNLPATKIVGAGVLGFGKEGGIEENFQTAIQNYEIAHARNETKDSLIEGVSKRALSGYKGILKSVFGEQLDKDEFEQAYSIMLGGAIGGPFNMFAKHRELKEDAQKKVDGANFSKFLKDRMMNIDDILTEELNGATKIDEATGNRVIDPEKFTSYFQNYQNNMVDPAIKEYAALNNDPILHKLVEPMAALKFAYRLFNNGLNDELVDELLKSNEFYNAPISGDRTISNKEIIDEVRRIFNDTKKEQTSVDKLHPDNADATRNYVKQLGYLKSTKFILESLGASKGQFRQESILDQSTIDEDSAITELKDTNDSVVKRYEEAIKELSSEEGYKEFNRVYKEIYDNSKSYLVAKAELSKLINSKIDTDEQKEAITKKRGEIADLQFKLHERNYIIGTENQELASELTAGLGEEETLVGKKKVKKRVIKPNSSFTFNSLNSLGRVTRKSLPTIDKLRMEKGLAEENNELLTTLVDTAKNTLDNVKSIIDNLEDTINDNPTQDTIDAISEQLTLSVGTLVELGSELDSAVSRIEDAPVNASIVELTHTIREAFKTLTTLIPDFQNLPTSPTAYETAMIQIGGSIWAGLNLDEPMAHSFINAYGPDLPMQIQQLEKVIGTFNNVLGKISNTAKLNLEDIERYDYQSLDFVENGFVPYIEKELDLLSEEELDAQIKDIEAIRESYKARPDKEFRPKIKNAVDSLLDTLIHKIELQKKLAGQESGIRLATQRLAEDYLVKAFNNLTSITIPKDLNVTTLRGVVAYLSLLSNSDKEKVLAEIGGNNTSMDDVLSNLVSMDLFRLDKFIEDYNAAKVKPYDKLTPKQRTIMDLSLVIKSLLSNNSEGLAGALRDPLPLLGKLATDTAFREFIKDNYATKKDSFDADLETETTKAFSIILKHLVPIDKDLYSAYISNNIEKYSLTAQQQIDELIALAEISKMKRGEPFSHVLIQGLAGGGKTRSLTSIIYGLLKAGSIVKYKSVSEGVDATSKEVANESKFKDLTKLSISEFTKQIEKGDVIVLDEAFLLYEGEIKALTDKANTIGALIIFAGDLSQNKNNEILERDYLRKGNNILPTLPLTVSYRTGHPGIAKLFNYFYLNEELADIPSAVANQSLAEFSSNTRGSMLTTSRESIVDMFNKSTGRTKVIIVFDSAAEAYYKSKGIDAKNIRSFDAIQGLEFQEVYVDVSYEDIVSNMGIQKANRAVYTALSRATEFVTMLSKGDNLDPREVSVAGYDEEFKKIKDSYNDGVKEAADILKVKVPDNTKKEEPKTKPEDKKEDTQSGKTEEQEDKEAEDKDDAILDVNPIEVDDDNEAVPITPSPNTEGMVDKVETPDVPNGIRIGFPTSNNLSKVRAGKVIAVKAAVVVTDKNGKEAVAYRYRLYSVQDIGNGTSKLIDVGMLDEDNMSALGLKPISKTETTIPIPSNRIISNTELDGTGTYNSIVPIKNYSLHYDGFQISLDRHQNDNPDWIEDTIEDFISQHNSSNPNQQITKDDILVKIKVFTKLQIGDIVSGKINDYAYKDLKPGHPYLVLGINKKGNLSRMFTIPLESTVFGNDKEVNTKFAIFNSLNRPNLMIYYRTQFSNYTKTGKLPAGLEYEGNNHNIASTDPTDEILTDLAKLFNTFTTVNNVSIKLDKVKRDFIINPSFKYNLAPANMKAILDNLHKIAAEHTKTELSEWSNLNIEEINAKLGDAGEFQLIPDSSNTTYTLRFKPAIGSAFDVYEEKVSTSTAWKDLNTEYHGIAAANKKIAGKSTRNSGKTLRVKPLVANASKKVLLAAMRKELGKLSNLLIYGKKLDTEIVNDDGTRTEVNGYTEYRERFKNQIRKKLNTALLQDYRTRQSDPEIAVVLAAMDAKILKSSGKNDWEKLNALDFTDYHISLTKNDNDNIVSILLKLSNIHAMFTSKYYYYDVEAEKIRFTNTKSNITIPVNLSKSDGQNYTTVMGWSRLLTSFEDQVNSIPTFIENFNNGDLTNDYVADWDTLRALGDPEVTKDLHRHVPINNSNSNDDEAIEFNISDNIEWQGDEAKKILAERFKRIHKEFKFPVTILVPNTSTNNNLDKLKELKAKIQSTKTTNKTNDYLLVSNIIDAVPNVTKDLNIDCL